MGRRSGKHKARAPVSAGGRRGRGARAGAGHPEEESQGSRRKRALWSRAGGRLWAGPREGVDAEGRGEARRGRARGGGEGGGTAVAGASLVSAPAFHSLSTFDRPELERSAACRYPEPPCCRCLLPPFAVGPSLSALCAPPCGPWMGKCSAATRLRLPASSRFSAGRAGAGEPGAAPAAQGAARAEPDGGASGRLLRESRDPEGRSAAASPSPSRRPRNVRLFTSSPKEAEESPVQPAGAEVRRARPGLQTLPLRKWCAALGEAEAALGAGVLPLRELLFTGEVGRALELPLAGRRVAAEWRTARARAGTRLDGDPVPGAGVPRGLRACAGSSVNDYRTPGVWTR